VIRLCGSRRRREHRIRADAGGDCLLYRLLPAGGDLYPAAPEIPQHRAAFQEPVRHYRRRFDGDHRGGHDYFQLTDPVYQTGVIGVAIWYALTILYFAAYGRKTLVFSPEEEFAVKHREGAVKV